MLSGVYRFKIVDALNYSPVNKLSGQYTLSSKGNAVWTSDASGDVFLEHLKVGLTTVLIQNDPNYFDNVINGARVLKGEATRPINEIYGRSVLMVPRKLDKQMLLTLTWIRKDFELNLMAESFIDSESEPNVTSGDACTLSFAYPKCKGMEHLTSKERGVLGQTIKVDSNLFYNPDNHKLIAGKRILVFVMDTA